VVLRYINNFGKILDLFCGLHLVTLYSDCDLITPSQFRKCNGLLFRTNCSCTKIFIHNFLRNVTESQ